MQKVGCAWQAVGEWLMGVTRVILPPVALHDICAEVSMVSVNPKQK